MPAESACRRKQPINAPACGILRRAEAIRERLAQAAHPLEPGVRAGLDVRADGVEGRDPDPGFSDHGSYQIRLELRLREHAADIVLGQGGAQIGGARAATASRRLVQGDDRGPPAAFGYADSAAAAFP